MVTSLFAKIAGLTLAGATALGGLAAAGALPASAQQAVASAASNLDISLPSPQGPLAGHSHHPDVTETDHPDVTETDHPDVTETDHPDVTATDHPDVTETDHPEVTETAGAPEPDNHGICVSYAAHIAESLGMTGSRKGAFISALAQDHTAVSGTATSAPGCLAAIAKARAAALGATGTADMNRNRPTDKASPDGSGSGSYQKGRPDIQGDSSTSGSN